MNPYWSWLLTAVGVTGLYLAGSRKRIGWIIGLCAQVLWLTYALMTHQYGFIASAGAYGWVYARNIMRWRTNSTVKSRPDIPVGSVRALSQLVIGTRVRVNYPSSPAHGDEGRIVYVWDDGVCLVEFDKDEGSIGYFPTELTLVKQTENEEAQSK